MTLPRDLSVKVLSRFSGQQDLIVGTDVANRNRVETENLIGFFTNLLPLRAKLAERSQIHRALTASTYNNSRRLSASGSPV